MCYVCGIMLLFLEAKVVWDQCLKLNPWPMIGSVGDTETAFIDRNGSGSLFRHCQKARRRVEVFIGKGLRDRQASQQKKKSKNDSSDQKWLFFTINRNLLEHPSG